MRKASPLVALILLALAAPARAQDPAPAAAPPPVAATATPVPAPAPAAVPPAAPAESVAAVPSAAAGTSRRKLQVGLSFLPMAMGRYTYFASDTESPTVDTYFAYGVGISAGYEVLPGLVVGLSPQITFNVQPKPGDTANPKAAKQVDIMARIAYELRPVDKIAVYAEVLPGVSSIRPSDDSSPSSGLVLAFGLGCVTDLTDRFFMNLGGGYEIGFQSQTAGVHTRELRTKYVRVALGGGVRF